MASLDSSIRSAARATYSAYKRQPIRWRLAGGSAALTLVILLGFAVIVGTLTTRAIYKDFNRQVVLGGRPAAGAASTTRYAGSNDQGKPQYESPIDLDAYAAVLQRRDPRRHRDRRAASTAPTRRAELRAAAPAEPR